MRETVRFLLGDDERTLGGFDPTTTVLDYLRGSERRTGTKEGCAEGDCGACSVVLGRIDGGALRYEAVNACIQFLPTLDGCQLITVEDLQGTDGHLHPVQQALVETHGSQCGFCTPGFVMSLFALYRSTGPEALEQIDDVLAGNLCRCTGYAPIVAAARRMYDLGPGRGDRFAAAEVDTIERLAALADEETLAIEGGGRRLFAPATTDALAEILIAHPDACILAGGTDVGLWVTKLQRELETIVYLGRIESLRRVVETPGAIEIGAMATYSDAAEVIGRHYPDFGELIRRLASVPIRNLGTIGGNIANGSPIGDSPPPLIALEATLHLRRGEERRCLPLEDYFLGYERQDRRPGEFVERIDLPKPAAASLFRCYKVSKRFDQDIAAVCAAFNISVEDGRIAAARIAYGGMAATPKRASSCEAALHGRPWTRETVEAAMAALADDFTPIDDWRASGAYRMKVAANLLLKAYLETGAEDGMTRLVGAGALAHV